MNIKPTIEYIRIKNSFAHKDTTITFDSGCNYIIGNYGSGKSELLELIGFSFFGTVALRGKSTTYPKLEVTLQFNFNSNVYKIIRTVKDCSIYENNLIKANTTTGVNNFIISLLGYDYSVYTLSNYCQQGKLQYFSELTPAKRSQYIDKLNGIEDAKAFSSYLKELKKNLKISYETHKALLNEPEEPECDLDVDYGKALENLPETSDDIIVLTEELKRLNTEFKYVPKKPEEPECDLLNDSYYNNLLEKFIVYCNQEELINSKINYLNSIIKEFNSNTIKTKLTLDEAKEQLSYTIKNTLYPVDINCPSCNHLFNTNIFKSDLNTNLTISELENIVKWLDPEYQDNIQTLKLEIVQLEKELNSLDFESNINKYISINNLKSRRKQQEINIVNYQNILTEIKNNESFNAELQIKIDLISNNIEETIKMQRDIVEQQKYLLSCKSQKDLYIKMFNIYAKSLIQSESILSKINTIDIILDKVTEITNNIQKESLPAISSTASLYLERLTRGVLHNIEITDSYEIIVDGSPINLRSGAQKDLASLAFRLSLGQSIVHGILPLFIGDEIDSASTPEVSAYIRRALQDLSLDGTQIIIVTHKDVNNYDNCNIIDLG